jgi:hypothetical protein
MPDDNLNEPTPPVSPGPPPTPETSLLAAQARQQKQEASTQAWQLLTPMAVRPAQVEALLQTQSAADIPTPPPAEEVVSVREVTPQSTEGPPEAGAS